MVRVRLRRAGGGPAGMMLGFLLARAGVPVTVLEKHPDFLRDFRGDTVHPSTLQVMHELGLLDEFLKLPHQKVFTLSAQIGNKRTPKVFPVERTDHRITANGNMMLSMGAPKSCARSINSQACR